MTTIEYATNVSPSYLVSFTNGCLEDPQNSVEFKSYGRSDGKFPNKKILVASSNKFDYVGKTFDANNLKNSSDCRYYIGFRNPKTNKMIVKDATYLRLNPVMDDAEEDREDNLSYREKTDRLTASFGSKRKQIALNSRMKFQVKDEEINSVLNKTVEGIIMESPTPKSPSDCNEIIPTMNKSATSPEDVFKIEDVVSEMELSAITNENEAIVAEKDLSKFSEFIEENKCSKYMIQLAQRLTKLQRKDKARLLLYMEYLITMHNTLAYNFRRKDPLPEHIPAVIKKKLMENFTQESGRKRAFSAVMKDKVAIRCLILALFIEDYKISIETLQLALKLKSNKLATFLRALGMKVESSRQSEKIAVFKFPLVFQKVRPSRRSI